MTTIATRERQTRAHGRGNRGTPTVTELTTKDPTRQLATASGARARSLMLFDDDLGGARPDDEFH